MVLLCCIFDVAFKNELTDGKLGVYVANVGSVKKKVGAISKEFELSLSCVGIMYSDDAGKMASLDVLLSSPARSLHDGFTLRRVGSLPMSARKECVQSGVCSPLQFALLESLS